MAKFEGFIPLSFHSQDEESMQQSSKCFYQLMSQRRTVRDFSNKAIPDDVLENVILTAGTAPSGANMQPWHFAVVKNAGIKNKFVSLPRKKSVSFMLIALPMNGYRLLRLWAQMNTSLFWKQPQP